MEGKRDTGLARQYRRWNGAVFGMLALIVVLWVLFAGEDVGLSNNGDFGRVMEASSLSYGDRTPSYTYVDAYVIDLSHGSWPANLGSILLGTQGLERYPSIHVGLVRLSVAASLVVNKVMGWEMGVYHMGVLGVMYALLYAVAIGLLCAQLRLRRLWQDVLVKLAAVAVLCDVGYVAYFNSFYGEALEHVMLVFCAAALLRAIGREKPTAWDGLWCALAAVGYGWAKFFNIPLAILLAVVMEGAVFLRGGRRWQAAASGCVAVAVLLAVWLAVPGWMDVETNYNAVFFGVVRDTDRETARRYLADLGLPEELADYRDTNYYMDGLLPELAERGLREAAESVTKGDLLRFYLTHPARLWEQLRITALHCGMVRPYYLANYGGERPLMSYAERMSCWSSVRDWLALDTVWGNLAAALIFGGLAALTLRRRVKPLWLALSLLALAGALGYAFALPVMLNGEGDFAKHMFAYIEIVDLMLLACLALALDGMGYVGRTGAACPVLGAALVLALALPPGLGQASALWRANAAHDGLEPGAWVALGSYEGRSLTWRVVEARGDSVTLLSEDGGISRPFDEAGDNDWRTSSLREWLNGDFLEGFSPEERGLLQNSAHELLLSNRFRGEAQAGEVYFSCSHIAVLAARDCPRAYRVTVENRVRLPGIDLAAALAQAGEGLADDCWLETPYCPSANLVRRMGEDGHIYFAPAGTARSVRAEVTVPMMRPASGRGSPGDPFRLV